MFTALSVKLLQRTCMQLEDPPQPQDAPECPSCRGYGCLLGVGYLPDICSLWASQAPQRENGTSYSPSVSGKLSSAWPGIGIWSDCSPVSATRACWSVQHNADTTPYGRSGLPFPCLLSATPHARARCGWMPLECFVGAWRVNPWNQAGEGPKERSQRSKSAVGCRLERTHFPVPQLSG